MVISSNTKSRKNNGMMIVRRTWRAVCLRVHRGSDIGSDHFLDLAKLRFPPKSLRLPKNTAGKENIKLVTQWLYKRRIREKVQAITESSRIVLEWRNIKTTMSQTADEIFWENAKHLHKRKKSKYEKKYN
jgi:hypothetical protein